MKYGSVILNITTCRFLPKNRGKKMSSALNFVKFSNPPSIIMGDEGVIRVICTKVILIFL